MKKLKKGCSYLDIRNKRIYKIDSIVKELNLVYFKDDKWRLGDSTESLYLYYIEIEDNNREIIKLLYKLAN